MDRAVRIMPLQRKSSFVQFPGEILSGLCSERFVIFEHLFSVHDDSDVVALNNDFLGPPFVVAGGRLGNIHQAIKTAGLDPIAVRIVDLAFEAGFRPALRLIFRMEIDASIGAWLGHYLDFEMEIFEWFRIADIKKMTTIAVRYKSAILDFPCARVF